VIEQYQTRAAAHTASRDAERSLSRVISRLRLATFIPGMLVLILASTRGMPPVMTTVGIVLLLAFGALVFWHAGVDARAAWYEALRLVNYHALARIGRSWDRLPPAEAPIVAIGADQDLEHHAYAVDLDLFGRASLLQWLGPAATVPGTRTLQEWMMTPAAPAEIHARQLAVAELADADTWREHLGGHGQLAATVRPHELEQFLEWAEGSGAFTAAGAKRLHVTALALVAAIWILIVAFATGFVEGTYFLIPIAAGMVLSFATAAHVHGEFNKAGAGHHAFARYADLFAHATAAPDGARHLRTIHSRLAPSGSSAPLCMRRLNRILGFAQLRAGAGIFHFVFQALTLWDFHVFFALDRWRRQVGASVRSWMGALGELDALSAFAQVKADNPAWCLPEVSESSRVFEARDLGHPLIPDDRRVGNDVTVGPPGTLVLITGSNMSGKSTLLRAIGLNAVLAQAGAPVCATSLRMPPSDLETSIRVHDSLEQGLSYFMAALARLKRVVDRSERARQTPGALPVMYLLDEILQGTNTAERTIAVRGVARHLLYAGAIGVMTTHDLGLAAEEPLDTAAQLVHFTEIVDEHGRMTFDYRLRPGLATSRNALRLMQLIGIELEPARDDGADPDGGPRAAHSARRTADRGERTPDSAERSADSGRTYPSR
jgi:MutS domain V